MAKGAGSLAGIPGPLFGLSKAAKAPFCAAPLLVYRLLWHYQSFLKLEYKWFYFGLKKALDLDLRVILSFRSTILTLSFSLNFKAFTK